MFRHDMDAGFEHGEGDSEYALPHMPRTPADASRLYSRCKVDEILLLFSRAGVVVE
jgi:hypothetical protein